MVTTSTCFELSRNKYYAPYPLSLGNTRMSCTLDNNLERQTMAANARFECWERTTF